MRLVTVLVSVALLAGCESINRPQPTQLPPSTTSVPTPSIPTPSISSITPASAIAGSSDLVLKVTGTNFLQDRLDDPFVLPGSPFAIWSVSPVADIGAGTELLTTFVSGTELTAVIPAALLSRPGTFGVTVMNGDVMGFTDGYVHYPRSNSVGFTVMPADTKLAK